MKRLLELVAESAKRKRVYSKLALAWAIKDEVFRRL